MYVKFLKYQKLRPILLYVRSKVAKLHLHFTRLKMPLKHITSSTDHKFHQNGFRTHIATCGGAAATRKSCFGFYVEKWDQSLSWDFLNRN